MGRFTRYFLRGLFILGPVIITAYVSYVIFKRLDALVFSRLGEWVQGLIPAEQTIHVGATVLGVLSCILLITLAGMVASNFVGRQLLDWAERILDRVPLIKLLYRSLKDLMGAFVGEKKGFEQPVFVALGADQAAKVIGFVTRQDAAFLGVEGHVAVYLPQAYNFAGQLVVVPRDRITMVELSRADAMTFVVSGGVSGVAPAGVAKNLARHQATREVPGVRLSGPPSSSGPPGGSAPGS